MKNFIIFIAIACLFFSAENISAQNKKILKKAPVVKVKTKETTKSWTQLTEEERWAKQSTFQDLPGLLTGFKSMTPNKDAVNIVKARLSTSAYEDLNSVTKEFGFYNLLDQEKINQEIDTAVATLASPGVEYGYISLSEKYNNPVFEGGQNKKIGRISVDGNYSREIEELAANYADDTVKSHEALKILHEMNKSKDMNYNEECLYTLIVGQKAIQKACVDIIVREASKLARSRFQHLHYSLASKKLYDTLIPQFENRLRERAMAMSFVDMLKNRQYLKTVN